MIKKIVLPTILGILAFGFWISPNFKEIAAGVAILSDDDDPNGTASTPTNPNNPTAGSNYCQQNPNSPDC